MDMETRSVYANDHWNLNQQWSFNLGFRYEEVTAEATGDVQTVAYCGAHRHREHVR